MNLKLSLIVPLILGFSLFACSGERPMMPKLNPGTDTSSSNSTAKFPDGPSNSTEKSTGTTNSVIANESPAASPVASTVAKVEDVAAELANVSDSGSSFLEGKKFAQWGTETLVQIEKDFRESSNHLYYENADRNAPAFAWGLGVQLHALIAANKITDAEALAQDIHTHYWCYKNNLWAVNASADNCGDRYFDDNAWIAKALLELYATDKNANNLDWARQIVDFSMSGENAAPNGGIRWHEGDKDGQCMCATAPTMVASLMLYQITGQQKNLNDAIRVYKWTKANDFGAGPGHRGYENAVIAQAAILLNRITGDASYLVDAQSIGHTMETFYIDRASHALRETAQWGGHDMANAYVDLYALDSDINWLNITTGYLSVLHDKLKDANGRYPEDWSKPGTAAPGVLYQASAARAYAKLGTTQGGAIKLADPVTLYNDCNFAGVAATGFPIGRFTASDIKFRGFMDKDASSLRVSAGFKVTFYDQDNFRGESLVKTADSSCLVQENWNDRVRSMVIEPVAPAAIVYKDCNYEGLAVSLPTGQYTLARLRARGISQKDISSIKVSSGFQVVGYLSDNFEGDKIIIDTNNPCLVAANFNDKITSIRVVKFK